MTSRSLLGSVVHGFRDSWRALILTDVAWKIIAFVVLTPLVAVLMRLLVALSGRSILADQDILLFFLGPVGWVCFIGVGSLWLGIAALEQAALLGVMCTVAGQERMGVRDALRFAARNCWPVVQVTARVLAWVLLAVAPIFALVGLACWRLLSEFDLNYYLEQKPPVFCVAVCLSGVGVAVCASVLLRLATSWFLVLPVVLFEQARGADALRVSRDRVAGHRRTLLLWVVAWVLAAILVSALATSIVLMLTRPFVARATGSLVLSVLVMGGAVTLSALVNLAVNLLGNATLATIQFSFYRQVGSPKAIKLEKLNTAGTAESRTAFELTRAKLLGMAIAGVVVAFAVDIGAITTLRLEDHTKIAAHRGASASAPENTLASVRQAIDDGADWVEIDVQETADGRVVLSHDADFMRVAGVKLKVGDVTLDDLEDIDVGSSFAPQFENERVPTLRDALATCRGKIRVIIELKYYDKGESLVQRVVDDVDAERMERDVVIMSANQDAVRNLKALRPHWIVGLVTAVAVGNLNKVEADFFAVSTRLATRPFVQSMHELGKYVCVWTINDAVTMSVMMGRNVDCVITDKPALARTVLNQRAAMSAPERLLLELAGTLGAVPELGEP